MEKTNETWEIVKDHLKYEMKKLFNSHCLHFGEIVEESLVEINTSVYKSMNFRPVGLNEIREKEKV